MRQGAPFAKLQRAQYHILYALGICHCLDCFKITMASSSRALRSLVTLRTPKVVRALVKQTQIRAATTSSLPNGSKPPPRRAVTVVSDTGRVPWKELSVGEKAARTTQQSMNLGIVLLGVGMTVGVATVLYLEVFSSDSKTAVFNRAADRVRKDDRCIQLLAGRGHGREIQAYGENSWSRWARNRFIAYDSHLLIVKQRKC